MGPGPGRSSDSEEHYSSAEEDTACTDHPPEGALAEHRQHGQVLSAGNRCQRLERVLEQCPCGKEEPDPQPEEEPTDLASALASLEAERKSRREVMQLNVVLREHLEITTRTNEELTREVRELTEEWQQQASSQLPGQQQQPQHDDPVLVSEWQQELEKLRGDLGRLRQAVLADLSGLGGALARLRTDCQGAVAAGDLSADRWEWCREIAGDLNQQVDSLNAENDGLQQALDKATRLGKELGQQLDDRVAEVERLEGQLSQLQAELSQAEERGRQKEESLQAQLEQQRGSSERELQSLRAALRRTQELHDQLHDQLHTGAQQEFSKRLEQQTRECTDRLESLLRQSEARLGELKRQLSQKQQELQDAQAALAEARAHGDALGRELAAVREQLSSSCREREEQAQALAQCEARHSAARDDWQGQLHTQRAALEEQLRRAQGRADRHAQACQQARTDLQALQERLSEEQRAHQEALAEHERQAERSRAEHDRELQRLREEHEGALGKLLGQQGQARQELSEQLRERTEACAALEERLRSQGEAFRHEAAQLQALQLKAQAAREAERQLLAQGLAACREQVRALGHQQAALQADSLRMLQQQGSTTIVRDVLRQLGQAEQSWEERQRRADQHAARLQLQLQEAARRSSQLESEQKVAAQRLADLRQSRDELLAEREQLHQRAAELQRELDRAVADKEAARQDSARMFREAEAGRVQLAAECGRLRAEHQEELQAQRSQAEATLLRESAFWKAKVTLCESEARACRVEREQLEAQLGELRECLSDERQAHQAQARALQQQRTEEKAEAQRRLLHEGQGLHRTRLALSAAQGRLSALEAHLGGLAETRQRSEAVLCSLLSALRCALGVAPPPPDGSAEVEEEQQLVVAAVQGLVSRVAALAKDKEALEAEADQWGREQRSLRAQLASSAGELQRATAARDRLSTENERLRSEASCRQEEASRLRLQLQELGWERASLGDQLHEATRRLGLLQRLQAAASSEPVLDRRLSEQQLAEVQLAEARLDQLKRRLDHQAAEKSRAEAAAAGGAPPPGAHQVQRLQAQLEAERLRSERLSERERALEAQLREALSRAHALATEGQRLRAEREALQQEKDTLETKFSAVAVQLAESEAAKQRLHQRRSGAASRDDSLRRQNEWLEKELGRVRHQLSRTVDVMFAQPRTSTPKPREAPEGDSLATGPPPPPSMQQQLEARLHTSLKVELGHSHQEGEHSFQQGRGDGLSAELERSLQAVAERPDRLRSESRRLERAIEETLPPSPPSPSRSLQGPGRQG